MPAAPIKGTRLDRAARARARVELTRSPLQPVGVTASDESCCVSVGINRRSKLALGKGGAVSLRACLSAGLIILASQLLGCGSNDARTGEVEGSRISQAAFQNGCRTVCTTCAPGTVCPHECRLDCPSGIVPCGDELCRGNEVCCDEVCSVCTHRGHACPPRSACAAPRPCLETALCIRGFHWSPQLCVCIPDVDSRNPDVCTTDADCRLFADYCTGCDCRSLSADEPDPTCSGPGVRCFADPCLRKTAICVEGRCTQTPGGAPPRSRSRTLRRPHTPHAPHVVRRPVR